MTGCQHLNEEAHGWFSYSPVGKVLVHMILSRDTRIVCYLCVDVARAERLLSALFCREGVVCCRLAAVIIEIGEGMGIMRVRGTN